MTLEFVSYASLEGTARIPHLARPIVSHIAGNAITPPARRYVVLDSGSWENSVRPSSPVVRHDAEATRDRGSFAAISAAIFLYIFQIYADYMYEYMTADTQK